MISSPEIRALSRCVSGPVADGADLVVPDAVVAALDEGGRLHAAVEAHPVRTAVVRVSGLRAQRAHLELDGLRAAQRGVVALLAVAARPVLARPRLADAVLPAESPQPRVVAHARQHARHLRVELL